MREFDDQHAALRFQHPSDFTCAFLAHFAREVVKHQGAQHHVELRLRERQHLGDGVLEIHVDSGLGGLRIRPRDHRWGRVNAEDITARPHPSFGRNGQTSGSAPYVEDRLISREMREDDETLAERATSAMGQQPDEKVVARGPMQDLASRRRCGS